MILVNKSATRHAVFYKVWRLLLICLKTNGMEHVNNASSLETFKYQLNPIFLDSRITAIKSLNSCTAPFPVAFAVLRRYKNRPIIIMFISMFHLSLNTQ